MARALFDEVGSGVDWVVHGDFHHHNILNSSRGFVAIDPKPYLADREYDVPAFLWNPMHNVMADRQRTEARIATFVAAGLDDYKIRACPIIRGSYLRASNDYVAPLRSLLSQRDRRWFDSAFTLVRLGLQLVPFNEPQMIRLLEILAIPGYVAPCAYDATIQICYGFHSLGDPSGCYGVGPQFCLRRVTIGAERVHG